MVNEGFVMKLSDMKIAGWFAFWQLLQKSIPFTGFKLKMDFEGVKGAISSGGYTLIDVRNPEEVQQHGKIPTGINIPCKFIQRLSIALQCFSSL